MQLVNTWLEQAKNVICREIFKQPTLAEKAHLSYGFPSKRAMSPTRKVVGEAWQTEEGVQAIFISPTQFEDSNYCDVLGILIHELIHLKIGVDLKHGSEFKKEMVEVGLEGKATATEVSQNLRHRLGLLKGEIGELPIAPLIKRVEPKKQTTRMLKVQCECKPPRTIRVSKKVIEGGGIGCMLCVKPFKTVEDLVAGKPVGENDEAK